MQPPSKDWLILRSRPLMIPMSTLTTSKRPIRIWRQAHEQNDNHEIEDKHEQWKTPTDKSNRNFKSSRVQVLDALAMAPQVMDAIAMAPQPG
ncbi:hypothetical protein C1H46_041776 [Malus baccata]|uniref:Uncharacterized protein n=1 Tax=Malus baccata TaxID=106549 RepID=A0A540KEQ1_MALBA|nr:hypothetical protein C1H46_041776 [Malus baccata]